MKKTYTAPKKLAAEVKKAHKSACGLGYASCGELVRKS